MSYFESETPNSWLLAPLSQNSSFLSGRGLTQGKSTEQVRSVIMLA